MKKNKIGEILVSAGAITTEQLAEALDDQKLFGGRLATILFEKCLISERQYLGALKNQLGIRAIDIRGKKISEAALHSMPREYIERYRVLPLSIKDGDRGPVLIVAMSDPADLELADEIQAITGKRIEPVLSLESTIMHAIHDYFIINGARGDYVMPAEGAVTLCGVEADTTLEIEHSRVLEARAPDPFMRGDAGELEDETPSGPPPGQEDSGGTDARLAPEVEVLVDLLVAKGLIDKAEYVRALLRKRAA